MVEIHSEKEAREILEQIHADFPLVMKAFIADLRRPTRKDKPWSERKAQLQQPKQNIPVLNVCLILPKMEKRGHIINSVQNGAKNN